MAEPSIFFSEVNERQGVFHRRMFLMGGFAGLGLAALTARLAHLQIIETQRYEKLSASNQFNFRLVPPPRGLIVGLCQVRSSSTSLVNRGVAIRSNMTG